MRLVVVDDNQPIRMLLDAWATGVGHEVLVTLESVAAATAWDGWAGTEGALVDWMMPGADGGVLLDWLAEHHPDIRCVILTARSPLPSHPHAAAVIHKDHLDDAMAALTG